MAESVWLVHEVGDGCWHTAAFFSEKNAQAFIGRREEKARKKHQRSPCFEIDEVEVDALA